MPCPIAESGRAGAPREYPPICSFSVPTSPGARQRMEAARFALGRKDAPNCCRRCLCQARSALQATDAGDWFDPDQWFRNLSVNLLGPAIQGSRLRDNVELAEAQLNEAAAAFGSSVVTAVNEVEATLLGLQAGRAPSRCAGFPFLTKPGPNRDCRARGIQPVSAAMKKC